MSFPVHYTYMYIGSVQNKQNIEDTASNLKLNSDGMDIPSLLSFRWEAYFRLIQYTCKYSEQGKTLKRMLCLNVCDVSRLYY